MTHTNEIYLVKMDKNILLMVTYCTQWYQEHINNSPTVKWTHDQSLNSHKDFGSVLKSNLRILQKYIELSPTNYAMSYWNSWHENNKIHVILIHMPGAKHR